MPISIILLQNYVEDSFRFLWPFQNLRTLSGYLQLYFHEIYNGAGIAINNYNSSNSSVEPELLSCITTNLMGYRHLVDFHLFSLTKQFPITPSAI